MGLKNIIPSTLLSLALATPMSANAPITQKQEMDDLETICQGPENTNKTEPEIKKPHLTEKFCHSWQNEKYCYFLSEEEQEHIDAVKSFRPIECKEGEPELPLANYQTIPYAGFVALMRHKPLIDFVADHYELEPNQIMEIMNHETGFNIQMKGADGERGLGQIMEGTAKRLINKVTNSDHPLFYPYIDKKDCKFQKLSTDYRLNIILTAAMVKTAQADFEDVLAGRDLTKQELAKKIRKIGQKDTLWHLRNKKSKRFSFYDISDDRRKRINRFWRDNPAEETGLFYLVYNGGRGSIGNLLKKERKAVAEVLLTNFTAYSKNKETINQFNKFIQLHKTINPKNHENQSY